MSDANRVLRSPAQSILLSILSLYLIWSTVMAFRHGMFRWGSLGDYSLFVYVLILAQIACALAIVKRTDRLTYPLLLIFFGCGTALIDMRPLDRVPTEMSWVFDLMGFVGAYAVVAAGVALGAVEVPGREDRH